MKFIPSGDRLIVDPIKEETRTASGLYINVKEDKQTQRAYIRAISVDLEKSGMNWQLGEEILLERFAGTALPNGEVIIGQAEIIARIDRSDEK